MTDEDKKSDHLTGTFCDDEAQPPAWGACLVLALAWAAFAAGITVYLVGKWR